MYVLRAFGSASVCIRQVRNEGTASIQSSGIEIQARRPDIYTQSSTETFRCCSSGTTKYWILGGQTEVSKDSMISHRVRSSEGHSCHRGQAGREPKCEASNRLRGARMVEKYNTLHSRQLARSKNATYLLVVAHNSVEDEEEATNVSDPVALEICIRFDARIAWVAPSIYANRTRSEIRLIYSHSPSPASSKPQEPSSAQPSSNPPR